MGAQLWHQEANANMIGEAIWFQLDGLTSYTASVSKGAVWLPSHIIIIISRNANIPWPPTSPDLSACDYFYGGTHCPYDIEELKAITHEKIAGIPMEMLHHVMGNVEYLWRDESHLKLYHLQEINGMLCTLRWLTCNLGTTISLFNYWAFKVAHLHLICNILLKRLISVKY
jgi:hypothetical protein